MPGLAVGLADGFPSIQINPLRMIELQNINDSVRFTYRVLVTSGQSVTPKFTFLTGAPRAKVLFGDGSSPKPVTSGVEVSYTYYVGGLYTIVLMGAFQELYLEQVDITGDHVVLPDSWPDLTQFKALTRLIDPLVIRYGPVGTFKIGR